VGFPSRLALATRNPGKVREILEICSDWPVRWSLATDAGGPAWPQVEETGETYLDNALLKARAAASALGVPAVADDSGIEVDALGGGPGPVSARFAGPRSTDEENLLLLIERLRGVAPEERTARYRCVAACAWPDRREVWAEGACEGRLILEPRGSGGFGYDPVFIPEGEVDRTMAQLSAQEKNSISHRGRALRSLGEILASSQS
jgi:non-canonical purine NTP pyrophosphatase (RdgB/HAM1 family)